MTKKRFSMLKLMLTAVLAMILCFGMALPAFAGEDPPTIPTPTEAAITKILQMPEGTVTPTITFTFTMSPVSLNGDSTSGALASMPAAWTRTIGYTSADDTDNITTPVAGAISIAKEVNIFGTAPPVLWDHAGVYVYKVTETGPGSFDAHTGDFDDIYTQSQAEYEITVYVKEGATPGTFVIEAVAASKTKTDEGTAVPGGEKIDPTPGGDGDEYEYSQMIFTNTYRQNNGVKEPEDPDEVEDGSVFDISKAVSGDFADASKYFAFDVKIANNSKFGAYPGQTLMAYVLEESSTGWEVVTAIDNYATIEEDDFGMKYIQFTAGTALTINLKHGQKLAFIDLPVGAVVDVTEQAAVSYEPAYSLTLGGGTPASDNASANTALGFSGKYIGGAGANIAAFTNHYESTTPTGIIVDNLPYIILIAIALIAIVAYVAYRYRRNARYEK